MRFPHGYFINRGHMYQSFLNIETTTWIAISVAISIIIAIVIALIGLIAITNASNTHKGSFIVRQGEFTYTAVEYYEHSHEHISATTAEGMVLDIYGTFMVVQEKTPE